MNRQDPTFSMRIQRALEARARTIPEDVDLWPRLQQVIDGCDRVGTGKSVLLRSGRRIILVAAVCAALFASSVAAAAASSPSFRHFLQQTVLGIPAGHSGATIDSNGQPLQIQPTPTFALFYPKSQPEGLTIRGIGQLNPRYGVGGFGSRYDCPPPPAACPPGFTVFIPPHPAVGLPSLLTPFQGTPTDVVGSEVTGSHPISGLSRSLSGTRPRLR
ncbi:MAG: hypothetical protein ACR2JC_04075 [Chloroflexota bacterium]|nr:MAG: hypothetical protein DLM70_10590 [Chloroflexota bacterium]